MAAIYDEIVLRWEGEEYTVQPSYEMLQTIEAQGISIVAVARRMMQGEPRMTEVSFVVAEMLKSADCDVKASKVYEHLLTDCTEKDFQAVCNAVITAFTPRKRDQQGNAAAPRKGGKKKAAKKKASRS